MVSVESADSLCWATPICSHANDHRPAQSSFPTPFRSHHPVPLTQRPCLSLRAHHPHAPWPLAALGRAALTKLLEDRVQLLQVRLVLSLVLRLERQALQDPDGGRKVVAPSGGLERRGEDRDGGDEVVRERVVEASLELKLVAAGREELLVSLVEVLVRLGLVLVRARARVEAEAWGQGGSVMR